MHFISQTGNLNLYVTLNLPINLLTVDLFQIEGETYLHKLHLNKTISAQYKLAIQMKFLLSERGWGNALLE